MESRYPADLTRKERSLVSKIVRGRENYSAAKGGTRGFLMLLAFVVLIEIRSWAANSLPAIFGENADSYLAVISAVILVVVGVLVLDRFNALDAIIYKTHLYNVSRQEHGIESSDE